jgi:hypothetical protein
MECWYQIWRFPTMASRKVAVELPPELLKKARRRRVERVSLRRFVWGYSLSPRRAPMRTFAAYVARCVSRERGKSSSMIASDMSTWVAFLSGNTGEDVTLWDRALRDRQAQMIPAVLIELLSDPKMSTDAREKLLRIPLVEIEPSYWQRAGEMRRAVLAKRRKARLAGALIAQSCIDRGHPARHEGPRF